MYVSACVNEKRTYLGIYVINAKLDPMPLLKSMEYPQSSRQDTTTPPPQIYSAVNYS